MSGRATRRQFLAGGVVTALGMSRARAAEEQHADDIQWPGTLDIHTHLFGTGDAGSGCYIAKKLREGPQFAFLTTRLQLDRDRTVDEEYVRALSVHLKTSKLTGAMVLAQDAVYDSCGRRDVGRTPFYVPNRYLLRTVARLPKAIPCVSINPQRRDAICELECCAALGARVLKIHPPIQGVDLMDKRYRPFLQRCADRNFLVMVHTGHEHSSPIISADLANPRRLEMALDLGCKVVACHAGTGWVTDPDDMLPDFLAMARRYKNLWGDTAVLGSPGRVVDMSRLLAAEDVRDRLLHGSDFPFPAMPAAFAGTIGFEKAIRIQHIENLLDQDLELKEALKIGRESAERAHRLVCRHVGGL